MHCDYLPSFLEGKFHEMRSLGAFQICMNMERPNISQ